MNNLLFAISGKMTSGKSTVAHQLSNSHRFKVLSIGSNIKIASQYLIEDKVKLKNLFNQFLNEGATDDIVYKLEYELHKQFHSSNYLYFEKQPNGTFLKNQSFRDLTQMVATTLRLEYGEDIWVSWISKQAKHYSDKGVNVIIDDLRLKNEKSVLDKVGFEFIRLNIKPEEQKKRLLDLYGEINDELLNHITEIDLDEEEFDLSIDTSFISTKETTLIIGNYIKNKNNERCLI